MILPTFKFKEYIYCAKPGSPVQPWHLFIKSFKKFHLIEKPKHKKKKCSIKQNYYMMSDTSVMYEYMYIHLYMYI